MSMSKNYNGLQSDQFAKAYGPNMNTTRFYYLMSIYLGTYKPYDHNIYYEWLIKEGHIEKFGNEGKYRILAKGRLIIEAIEGIFLLSNNNEDNEISYSDQLEAIGFQFSDPDCMYQYVGVNNSGPQIIVNLHDNSRQDNYMFAKSLSLYWKVQPKLSGSFSIADDPTLKQIKDLLTALKGE